MALPTTVLGPYSERRQYREDLADAVALSADDADGSTGEGFGADAITRVGGDGGGPVEPTVDRTCLYYNTPGLPQTGIDAIVEAYGASAERGVVVEGAHLVLVTYFTPLGVEAGSVSGGSARSTRSAPGAFDPIGAGQREPDVAAGLSTEASYIT